MPEVQQVHIDAALTNLSVEYNNNDYVAELLAPRVAVRKQSDRYFIYDSEQEAMRPRADLRAPGTLADEVNYSLSTDSYFCEDHALSSAVPDEERENADPVIQPDMDRTEYLTERILLNQEVRMHDILENSSGIGEVNVAPGNEWNDPESNPFQDIQSARLAIFATCQRLANTLVLPPDVYEALRNHPAVVERIKYSDVGVVTPQLLARVFDVGRVVVPRCHVNTSAPGQPPQVSPLWSDAAYMLYVTDRPGLKQLTFANTFVWNGMPGSSNGVVVERWRDHGRKADMIRVQKYYDIKVITYGAAQRITDILG